MKFNLLALATIASLAMSSPVSYQGNLSKRSCHMDLEGVQHCVGPQNPATKRQCLVWKDDDGNLQQYCSQNPPQVTETEVKTPTVPQNQEKRQCVAWIDEDGNTQQSCSTHPPQEARPTGESPVKVLPYQKRQCYFWIDEQGVEHYSCSQNPPQVQHPG
jgi:hypothetical protein